MLNTVADTNPAVRQATVGMDDDIAVRFNGVIKQLAT